MAINTYTLSNGLRIIHAPSPTSVAIAAFQYEQELAVNHLINKVWLT